MISFSGRHGDLRFRERGTKNGRQLQHRSALVGRRLLSRGRLPPRRAVAPRGAGGDPGCHRAQRHQRLLPPGPREGSPSSRRSRCGPALRRRAVRHQGAGRGGGLARHRCLARLQGPQGHPHLVRDRQGPERRRCRTGGPHHGERVRRAQRERHEAQRRDPQPVAARSHRGRVLGWIRGRGGRWVGQPGERRRRWWFHPHPRWLHRPARLQGHVRSHLPRAPGRVPARHGRGRQPGPLGARRGPLLRRGRRCRPP